MSLDVIAIAVVHIGDGDFQGSAVSLSGTPLKDQPGLT
jgi:hypothetical protein